MFIDIISPAGSHLDLPGFDRACERLTSMGYKLHVRAPRESWQRFGGSDDARLSAIHEAARGHANLVMLTRGGYGLSRLIDRIDWPLISKAIMRGQRWMGYSDFTTFQLALYTKTGAGSLSGPCITGDFGDETVDPLMLASFQASLRGATPLVQWEVPRGDQVEALKALATASRKGVLWGGNATMVANLVGTPFFPSQLEHGLLWMEEVGDHPYRIERLLHQLHFAGVLEKQRALIFGGITQWRPAPHDNGYSWEEVLKYWRARLPGVLILDGLPFGHQPSKAVMEFGREYRLSAHGQTFSLVPSHSTI